MQIKKKNWGGVGLGGSGGGWVGGGGCRFKGGLWGVRVDVNEELRFLGKFTKKKISGGGDVGSGGGQVGGGGQGGCERNVGGRGDVGYGGCEPRIEGIVQCTKRYCTILRK